MDTYSYDRWRMPKPSRQSGAWGEAIQYWLDRDNLTQADLVRRMNTAEFIAAWNATPAALGEKDTRKGTTAKTISQLVRGFHTHTRLLAKVAFALNRSMHEILVTPSRALSQDMRLEIWRQVHDEMLVSFLRQQPRSPSIDTTALSPGDRAHVDRILEIRQGRGKGKSIKQKEGRRR